MSPKETFIEIVKEWREAKNYDELRALKIKHFDKILASHLIEDAEQDNKSLMADDKARMFEFDQHIMPSLEMAESAVEEIKGDQATLTIPQMNRVVHMGLQDGEWKYIMENDIQGYSSENTGPAV